MVGCQRYALLSKHITVAGEIFENGNRPIRDCLCHKSLGTGIWPSIISSIAPR